MPLCDLLAYQLVFSNNFTITIFDFYLALAICCYHHPPFSPLLLPHTFTSLSEHYVPWWSIIITPWKTSSTHFLLFCVFAVTYLRTMGQIQFSTYTWLHLWIWAWAEKNKTTAMLLLVITCPKWALNVIYKPTILLIPTTSLSNSLWLMVFFFCFSF